MGSITGAAQEDVVGKLRAIDGVIDVSPDAPMDVGPPDSPVVTPSSLSSRAETGSANEVQPRAGHTLWLLSVRTVLGIGATSALTRVVRAAGGGGTVFDTPDRPAFAVPVLIVLGIGTLATC